MPGSFVCLRADSGRRGLLRIDQMPDLDDARPRVVVTGVAWETIVDR